MAKATKKKLSKKPAGGKRTAAPAKAKAKAKAKAMPKAAKPRAAKPKTTKAAAKLPALPIARLETFAPAPKKPLELPVTASTAKPIRPVSLRRSRIERTVPGR